MAKILYAEDDLALAAQITSWFENEGHIIEIARNGAEAQEKMEYFKYDAIILDWELPDASGVALCKGFRSIGGQTPVLMLTGRQEIKDKEDGFDAGADDYLTKPFSMRELSARIKALLRRPAEFMGTSLSSGVLRIETGSRNVFVGDTAIQLQPKEFAILEYLLRHKGRVVTTQALLEGVWHSDSEATSQTVYTHMKTLRKKLLAAASIIRTVHGVGYTIES